MSIDEERAESSGLVGKRAGDYLIVSQLAADARRTLYVAEHVELGTRVTLGVVRGQGSGATERLREGEKLRALKQPGLVSVLDVGKLDSGDLFVATERAIGTSLRSLITGKLLDQRRALGIIRQVLEALAAAHAVGAIHGDIKPESNLVTADGGTDRIKLTDLGVATLAGATAAGDPRYSAPESSRQLDARTDLYSVGAVLFELLTGYPPFHSDDETTLRRLHAYAPVQTLKARAPDRTFVRALEELVAMALAKKPPARLQSAADTIALLDNALQSIVEAAPPEAEAARRRKPNDSLLVLAKDLIPASQAEEAPAIPVNTGRQVPELPITDRALATARSLERDARGVVASLRERFDKLDRRHRLVVIVVAAVFVLALVIAILV
jgi:serine/threonine-protein kinase